MGENSRNTGLSWNDGNTRGGAIIDLLKKIIFHDPRIHFSGIINPDFPKQKSLFSVSPERGLPLWDLVSQILGNFYLHTLDHFVKHTLCMKYYGRYMDDMIFFHTDRALLERTILQIRDFLNNELWLELHEWKIILNTCEQGILFLGAYIKPWRTYIGNRTKKNMYACISSKNEEKFEAQMQSYLGLMWHFETYRLERKVSILSGKAIFNANYWIKPTKFYT